jgi:hypothetical protein
MSFKKTQVQSLTIIVPLVILILIGTSLGAQFYKTRHPFGKRGKSGGLRVYTKRLNGDDFRIITLEERKEDENWNAQELEALDD